MDSFCRKNAAFLNRGVKNTCVLSIWLGTGNLSSEDLIHIYVISALFGHTGEDLGKQILCIFTSFPPCLSMLTKTLQADSMHIYVIPALFCHTGKALGKQILCIFTSFPPCLSMLTKTLQAYSMHICVIPALEMSLQRFPESYFACRPQKCLK